MKPTPSKIYQKKTVFDNRNGGIYVHQPSYRNNNDLEGYDGPEDAYEASEVRRMMENIEKLNIKRNEQSTLM